MARGGFLGRIGRAIRRIVAPPPRPPAPPPKPPPPPEPPRRRDPYREIWRNTKEGRRGDYRKNRAVFDRMMSDVQEQAGYDEDDLQELWESYVKNIVNKGPKRRQDSTNPFWQDSGIDPADFNWQRWREAMGYTGKRRSRS